MPGFGSQDAHILVVLWVIIREVGSDEKRLCPLSALVFGHCPVYTVHLFSGCLPRLQFMLAVGERGEGSSPPSLLTAPVDLPSPLAPPLCL